MRLKGKVAIITGAGRGIGLAAARAFAREGAAVVIAEIEEAMGREAERILRAGGGEATFVRTDCSVEEDVRALMVRTEQLHGRLDVLYNNASIFLAKDDGPITDVSAEVWDRVLSTNLGSVFFCCRHGIPLMMRGGGGSIINTGSSASVMGIPGCDAYTATKGATVALTRSMAVEFGRRGIRVNCICPAGIETDMVKASSLENPAFDREYFFRRAPMARFGTPEEVAALAVFLASDESSYLNGAIIRADGGITIAPIS